MPFATQAVIAADGWSMHGDVGFGWWFVMTLAMILFWGGVIALIVWLLRGGSTRPTAAPKGADAAREILDRRLAEGDLSVDEYEQRRQLLERRAHGAVGADVESGSERTAPPDPAAHS